MPEFKAEASHELTKEVAVARLRQFGDRMRDAYANDVKELEEEWHEDGRFEFSFRVMGLAIAGNMVTTAESVHVQGTLPFAALPFRGQLENEIRRQLQAALENDESE